MAFDINGNTPQNVILNITGASNQDLKKIIYNGNLVWEKKKLPNEYQEVAYIETRGTQYINTGFYPDQDTKLKIKYMLTSTKTQVPFGTRTSANTSDARRGLSRTHGSSVSRIGFGNGTGTNVTISDYNLTARQYEIYYNKNQIYINGDEITTIPYSEWTALYPIYIGGVDTANSMEYGANARFYSCQIWNDNTLARDFVPCYRKLDNEIGLYDLVNDTFYTNQGTGDLVAGPNVN